MIYHIISDLDPIGIAWLKAVTVVYGKIGFRKLKNGILFF
jgi:hypothetical protein